MRNSSKFVIAGLFIVIAYLVDVLFFNVSLEIIRIAGYVVFAVLVAWVIHGIAVEKKGKKTHRAEELLTHPFLMICLLTAGILFIILAIYNLIVSNLIIITFTFMLEIGILFILLAYNNMKEGRKRGHW
jgi:fatty acid desaturase